MSDPVSRIQSVARAELVVAEIQARRMAAQTVLFAVALVFAFLGFGMLNFAIYLFLSAKIGGAWAAFVMAACDGLLALGVVMAARNAGPSETEEKLAHDLRDMAYAEVNHDIDEIRSEIRDITNEVKGIRSGFVSAVATVTNALSLFKRLIRSSRRKGEE